MKHRPKNPDPKPHSRIDFTQFHPQNRMVREIPFLGHTWILRAVAVPYMPLASISQNPGTCAFWFAKKPIKTKCQVGEDVNTWIGYNRIVFFFEMSQVIPKSGSFTTYNTWVVHFFCHLQKVIIGEANGPLVRCSEPHWWNFYLWISIEGKEILEQFQHVFVFLSSKLSSP